MPFEDKRNRRNRLFWGLAPHLPALRTRRNFLDVPAARAGRSVQLSGCDFTARRA